MVIGFQIRKLHRGAVLDSKSPACLELRAEQKLLSCRGQKRRNVLFETKVDLTLLK